MMLFVSVLLHELGHSVVAKQYGIAVPRITLFVFGGVSEIATEPYSPRVEFWIATSGPVVSFALALIFWELQPLLAHAQPLLALAKYLAILNFVLGVFNLAPGFHSMGAAFSVESCGALGGISGAPAPSPRLRAWRSVFY